MSKWIDESKYEQFVKEKKEEAESTNNESLSSLSRKWMIGANDKGTQDRAKVYEIRFLPDPKGSFYKKLYYHMYRVGEQWFFSICPKTFDFNNYCAQCAVTNKLYMGSEEDKALAKNYKRKEKYAGNVFIVDDPRDAEKNDEDKVTGKVKIYEFPGKVESKLKETLTDTKHGLGMSIFDPGEEGFNFILKVKSTKPESGGRTFPDYSDSTFAHRPTPLAESDKEIREVLKSTHDLDDYLKGLVRSEDDIIDKLKIEMVWDLVEDEYKRMMGIKKPKPQVEKSDQKEETEEKEDVRSELTNEETEEDDDESLLAELADL